MVHQKSAFSLLELTITLFIASIIFALLIPSYQSFLEERQESLFRDQLQDAIHLARQMAGAYNTKITLCSSAHPPLCEKNWRNDFFIIKNTEHILQTFSPPHLNGILHWRAPLHYPDLQFFPNALTYQSNGTFWYCPNNAEKPRWAIVINREGRTRVMNACRTCPC